MLPSCANKESHYQTLPDPRNAADRKNRVHIAACGSCKATWEFYKVDGPVLQAALDELDYLRVETASLREQLTNLHDQLVLERESLTEANLELAFLRAHVFTQHTPDSSIRRLMNLLILQQRAKRLADYAARRYMHELLNARQELLIAQTKLRMYTQQQKES